MIPKLDVYIEHAGLTSSSTIKPGLEAIRHAMQALGNPQAQLRAIHVAGTNGKGSTVAFMESILQAAGVTTGVFSSPAMIDIHDQIRLNGRNTSSAQLQDSFRRISEAGLDGCLTDFELLTAAAFVTFGTAKPDVILVECGLGGRFDSTNVLNPAVTVITSVAKEHTEFLGYTLESIAWHKAGIFRPGIPAVVGDLPREAMAEAEKIAAEGDSPLYRYGNDFSMEGDRFCGIRTIDRLNRKLKGPHQAVNAAMAIEAVHLAYPDIEEEAVRTGIGEAQLSFRFEEAAPGVFFDGAHNPAAAKRLRETIEQQFPGEIVDFVIGMMANKDIEAVLAELIPVAASFTFVDFDEPGATSAETLYEKCRFGNKQVTDRLDASIILKKNNGRKKIVSGSLYLLNSLKSHILQLEL
ncbi:bifunctional folylpolyglutamate synthase/dihydrofolate synthase [Sporosarcina koreensis]|uniref:bifunctional folylpolyglutamate synthase/dihydrofolate synthase n=1 Tax=Sporosarcina koreensis TaxID=334735 RepID=UPI00058B0A5B|nr:folylpolyglutamate synthase/dihydrofolate synthase family protein [Sporosarcina koreensis]